MVLQAEQAVAPDQQREFAVNFQDRKSGEMRLSIKVPYCCQTKRHVPCIATHGGTCDVKASEWHLGAPSLPGKAGCAMPDLPLACCFFERMAAEFLSILAETLHVLRATCQIQC